MGASTLQPTKSCTVEVTTCLCSTEQTCKVEGTAWHGLAWPQGAGATLCDAPDAKPPLKSLALPSAHLLLGSQ